MKVNNLTQEIFCIMADIKVRYWKLSIGEYVYCFNYVTHWQPIVKPEKEKLWKK